MKVKRYKQYCWYKNKLVSALKEYEPEDYDDPFCGEHFYDRNNYRPMHFKVLDSNGNPCSSLEKMSFGICDDYPEESFIAHNYVNAVFGEVQEWMPATVEILCSALFVWIVRFPSDGIMVDFESIMIDNIPNNISFQIDIDAVEGFESERYMIYSVADKSDEKSESHFIVKEYKNDILKRTCEMGYDKRGTFELITEAE